MPVAELHFFHADDPNGSTIFECSTDDEFVKGIELDIQRDSLGGGKVHFARKVPAGGLFQREIIEPETLVRVLLPAISTTKYYWGFFINPRQQQVISEDEQGGEGFTFAGPGPKHYLERMLLWSASFSGNDNAVQRESGIWTWPETAKVGRILNRLIEEDQDNPSGPFLPDLTKSFGDTNDSDSVAWVDDVSGTDDLTLRIQDTYLKILWILEDLSGMVTDIDLGEVGNPLIQLNAYQTYGTDRTASILFEEGNNIAAELNVEGSSYAKASHALVKGDDGVYELAVRPGWSAGQLKKVVATSWDSSNNTQLDNAGERFLRRQQNGERQIKLNIIPGTTALDGEYFPGPPGTGSDFWVGDLISLTTGMGSPTELDYQDEEQTVTGIQLELTEAVRDDTTLMAARSWSVQLALNEERKSSNTSRDLAGNRGTVTAPPLIIRLCRAKAEGEVSTARLYYTSDNDASGLTDADYSPSWDVADTNVVGPQLLSTTPQDTYSNAGSDHIGLSGIGLPANTIVSGIFTFLLSNSADVLSGVQNGGTWRTVIRSKNRYGAGVSETAQENYPTGAIRVWRPGTGFIGTILDVGDWQAVYRFDPGPAYPSIPMEGSGAAVASAVGTDYLVVDLGADHVAPTSGATGWGYRFSDQSTVDDLPYVVDSVANQNSWLEVASTIDDAGSVGDGNVRLVGTSTRVKRCDDTEHWHDSREPTPLDDWDQGMREGTLWLDDTTGRVWWLTDNTAGAAVWVLISDPLGGGSSSSLIIEDNDTSGVFDTLITPDNTLTDNGDGSVTLDVAPAVHAHDPATPGFHGVLVKRTTDFTSTNSNDSVPDFDTVLYDTDALFDAGDPDRLTIPADFDGLMMQFYAAGLWATGTDNYVELKLYRNVTRPIDSSTDEDQLIAVTQLPPASAYNTQPILISPPVQVAEGDTFYIAFRTPASETVVDYFDVSLLFGGWIVGSGGGGSVTEEDVMNAGRWEVVVSGTAPPVAVTNEAEDDWLYAWVPGP